MRRVAKAIVAGVVAAGAALAQALTSDSDVTVTEWSVVVVAIVAAVAAVYATKNAGTSGSFPQGK